MEQTYEMGDHICTLFDTEEEKVSIASHYLAEGLRRGERCLYAAPSRDALDRMREALDRLGIDAAGMVRSGALIEATTGDVHLQGGCFDSERMLRLLNEAAEAALNAGFTGLRTCGDMSWLLDDPPGATQVVEYEALLNQLFQTVRVIGMCLYDRQRLSPALVESAGLAAHPTMVLERRHRANPSYVPRPPASQRPLRS